MNTGLLPGLVDAETKYYYEIRNRLINVETALETNELYCDKLFELRGDLRDSEEIQEIDYEIDYLIVQAKALRKLNTEEKNNDN